MDSMDIDRALDGLEGFLRSQGASVRRLDPEAFEVARARWRRDFGPAIGAGRWSWQRQGYDWHVFSLERHEALEGGVATQAFANSTANVHRFVVLSAVDEVEVGLEVASERAIDLASLGEDWSMVADDWSWSMSWTSDVEGPYFARP